MIGLKLSAILFLAEKTLMLIFRQTLRMKVRSASSCIDPLYNSLYEAYLIFLTIPPRVEHRT